jgi:hypothetical protein
MVSIPIVVTTSTTPRVGPGATRSVASDTARTRRKSTSKRRRAAAKADMSAGDLGSLPSADRPSNCELLSAAMAFLEHLLWALLRSVSSTGASGDGMGRQAVDVQVDMTSSALQALARLTIHLVASADGDQPDVVALKAKWRVDVLEGLYTTVCDLIEQSGASLLSVLSRRVGVVVGSQERPTLAVRKLFLVFQTLYKLMLVLDPNVYTAARARGPEYGLSLLTSTSVCESSAPRAKSVSALAPTNEATVQRVCDTLLMCISKVCAELPSFADLLTDLARGVKGQHIDSLLLATTSSISSASASGAGTATSKTRGAVTSAEAALAAACQNASMMLR